MFCTIRREAVLDPARGGTDLFPDPDLNGHAGLSAGAFKPSQVNAAICAELKSKPVYQMELEDACFTLTDPRRYQMVGGASNYEQVCVAFAGDIENADEVAVLYGMEPLGAGSGAQLIFTLYNEGWRDRYGDDSDQPSTMLNALSGDWAFVLFDRRNGYHLAARSRTGRVHLYWGLDKEERALVYSSDPLHHVAHESEFPKACFFESQLVEGEGDSRIEIFTRLNPAKRVVNTMPKLDSKGHLKALLVTSPSGRDLCNGNDPVDMDNLEGGDAEE